jgi:SAM-dependent methyltransferase
MENERARSYALMERSDQYLPQLRIYLPFLKGLAEHKGAPIRVLNLGCSSGILEELALAAMPDMLRFVSVDSSGTFLRLARTANRGHLRARRLRFVRQDVTAGPFGLGTFDLILARDLNHHLLKLDPVLRECRRALGDGGIMLMEDLRFRADPSAVLDFCRLVLAIPAFQRQRSLLYLKLAGVAESFASAYATSEVARIATRAELFSLRAESAARYHLLLGSSRSDVRGVANLYHGVLKG